MKFYKNIIVPLLLICFSAVSFTSSAGAMCDSAYEDALTPNMGCEIGSSNNDNPLPGQVNADMMFSIDTWELWDKQDSPEDPQSGSFYLELDPDLYDVMVVFKGGSSETTDPNLYVGYLLELSADGQTYDWTSPFTNTNNGSSKDVSHITFYYNLKDGGGPPDCLPGECCEDGDDCDPDVPEPQTLFTLGLALCGFAFRKKLMS